MSNELTNRLERAIKSLPAGFAGPEIGLVLGSGLGAFADQFSNAKSIDYEKIDGLVGSTAPGHKGALLSVHYRDVPMLVCQGRVHLYEGYSPLDIVMPVYLLRAIGVKTLILTNAAGGLNSDYEPGSVVAIKDHINLTGCNPLIGVDVPEIGVRFPDMSRAYSSALRALLHKVSPIDIQEGIYAGVTGPSLETSAERRFYRQCGGDMIGMSTIMEVIAANHCGLDVLGLSVITNKATGGADQEPDTLEDVLANAAIGEQQLQKILGVVVPEIAALAKS